MNYAVIKKFDIANGPGVRVSLFVSGCRHHCKNCFNREAWDFQFGKPFTKDVIDEIMKALDHEYITGLSLLGGEPFEPENQQGLIELLTEFHKAYPDKNVWCYSGFKFDEEILAGRAGEKDTALKLLSMIDVLVDGKFVEALKSPNLLFRGSSNQRIIDVKKSLEQQNTVLLEGVWERKMGSGSIYE